MPGGFKNDSPYVQKEEDLSAKALTSTVKSYRNEDFLNSYEGRLIRILCEFEEPERRLKSQYIRSTVLFFGSARAMTTVQFDKTIERLTNALAYCAGYAEREELEDEIARLRKTQWMCEWVDGTERLARMVAEFSVRASDLIDKSFAKLPDYFRITAEEEDKSLKDVRSECHDFVVTTGGGPGFMEAANRGAASVPGVKTMGMGISLPFEKGLNAYVSNDLAFEFHYFFTRKYWMMYSCRAIVVAPGGFGTLDETFELLTLRQTRKIPNLPVVLFGKSFWHTAINWQALADLGVIAQQEVDSLCFTDSPDEAMKFIEDFYVSIATS